MRLRASTGPMRSGSKRCGNGMRPPSARMVVTAPLCCSAASTGEASRPMARTRVAESLEDGVLVLVLNRPDRKNAFDEAMWREARDALADAQANDAVRAVLVTGA